MFSDYIYKERKRSSEKLINFQMGGDPQGKGQILTNKKLIVSNSKAFYF